MSLRRIKALIRRDFWISKRLKWKLVETFFFPVTSIVIWGFFTIWAENLALEAAFIVLAANMFWSFAYQSQSNINQQMMDDRWSESFKQVMLTPIRPVEYLFGKIVLAVFWAALSFAVIISIAYIFFNFTILLEKFLYFLFLTTVTLISSVAISILTGSVIMILGNEYGFFSWSITQLFILFSAPFFPLTTYPSIVQKISKLIPYTWLFESIRMLLQTGNVHSWLLIRGFGLAVIYFAISLPIYSRMFEIARKKGKLSKLW